MRPATLLAPAIAAERRVMRRVTALERDRLRPRRADPLGSIEIDEDEILDDLLYPADHRSLLRPLDPAGAPRPRR